MRLLSSLILTVALLIAAAVAAVNFAPETIDKILYFSVCNQPVKYRVDQVDPRFNLTREEFVSDINQASQIWNAALEKKLFMYDPQGDLNINLVYDERQSLTTQITLLETTVQSEKASLNPKISEFQRLSAEFKQKVNDLNKIIEHWNNQGGAPPEEYDKIIAQQQELKAEGERLRSIAQNLNISTQEYNQQVAELNNTIKSFNNALDQKPEGGLFKGPEYEIEIYFNTNKAEIVHTLAHELGHALGLKHTDDPKSLMYYKTHQGLAVTNQDLAELERVCRKQSIIELYQDYFARLLVKYRLLPN